MTVSDDAIQELQKIPWFQELKPEHVKRLASITEIRNVKAGDVLFREGDT
jgi:CRP-like cAMP-binding protein